MEKPLLTVCCVAYNHAPYIRQALDSVLMQKTDFPFEILIHDDCSTDGTTEIIREYEEKYPDIIKLIYETENQYSKGIKIIRDCMGPSIQGKYVALLECDDYWTDPKKLQVQISYMEQHPDCSGTFHAADWINNEKFLKNDRRAQYEFDATPQQVIRGGGEYCATASLCYRRQYIWDYPEFRVVFDVGDYPLQILLALRGKFHYFPETMSCYRFGRVGSWTQLGEDIIRKSSHLKIENNALKKLNEYTKGLYETEIYYRITKNQSDLYAMGQIHFGEIRESFSHMKWSHMKLSRMRRCYDRLLRKYIPGIKQKY